VAGQWDGHRAGHHLAIIHDRRALFMRLETDGAFAARRMPGRAANPVGPGAPENDRKDVGKRDYKNIRSQSVSPLGIANVGRLDAW
jgi:hypothetical protein